MKIVKKISTQKTIFFISHRLRVLKICDVVYKLENGKLYNTKLD